MKTVDRLEDTLNGKFPGLYAEVVTFDCYKVKDLNFIPDVVIDLGANVGAFTRFARELFPQALIVSVEPDEENFANLIKFTMPSRNEFLNEAIGEGDMIRRMDENSLLNGAHASYLPVKLLGQSEHATIKSETGSVMLDSLFDLFVKPSDKVLIKVDVEGAEFALFEHEPSLKCFERADYFAFELHHEMEYYTDPEKVIKRKAISKFIQRLSKTHSIVNETVHLFGVKK